VNWNWESNSQYLAQIGHFLGAALFVLVAGTFWGPPLPWGIIAIGVAVATLKEFLLDLLPSPYGEGDSFVDSIVDWTFYILGGVVGSALFEVAVHLHRFAS